jgi:hypothetical protein
VGVAQGLGQLQADGENLIGGKLAAPGGDAVQRLDPDNALIRRDLGRATRIQSAVRRPSLGG